MDDDLTEAESEMLRLAWEERPKGVILFSGEEVENMAKVYRDRGEYDLAETMEERADITTAVLLKLKGLGEITVDVNGTKLFLPTSAGLIRGSKDFENDEAAFETFWGK